MEKPNSKEIEVLRRLADRVRSIAELPEMEERKRRWYNHNALKPERPLVLCFPEGAWVELLPDNVLQCENEKLRAWEMNLRQKIYWWEHIRDDHTLEPWFDMNWKVDVGSYGVPITETHGGNRGSYTWDAPIKDIDKDFHKLKFRELSVNKQQTENDISLAQEIFGDLLSPRIRGDFWWTMGLTAEIIKFVGLENFMLYMYDEPDNLHRLMAWIRDEHIHYIEWLEKEGLLSLNNRNGYTGSGGVAYTNELPQKDLLEGQHVRLKDIWGFAESQETVGVSPDMFAEFVFPYQLPILEKFGLNCYGCCEAVHERWKYISKIPNLRRVSVSPWCNQEIMADQLGKNYIFSRKPSPTMVSAFFDEDEIRKDIRNTLEIAKDGVLEIILKDTHTVQNQPQRLTDWVRIALEEVIK